MLLHRDGVSKMSRIGARDLGLCLTASAGHWMRTAFEGMTSGKAAPSGQVQFLGRVSAVSCKQTTCLTAKGRMPWF